MKTILLYILVAATLASCSSAYKASQTPDDVYHSPSAEIGKKEDKNEKKDKYEEYVSAEDKYLRMKVKDRRRWSEIDEYEYRRNCLNNYDYSYYKMNHPFGYSSYGYSSYGYGYNSCACACNNNISIYHPSYYNYYGYYNNPYIINYPVKTQKGTYKPNLGSYQGGTYNNNNGIGNTLKKVFSSGNNGYNNRNSSDNSTYRSTDRSYTPSSNSSSSGSSSGSGGRVSRPGRN